MADSKGVRDRASSLRFVVRTTRMTSTTAAATATATAPATGTAIVSGGWWLPRLEQRAEAKQRTC